MSEADVALEAQLQIQSLYRQLYAAEQLIQELERQRDQVERERDLLKMQVLNYKTRDKARAEAEVPQ